MIDGKIEALTNIGLIFNQSDRGTKIPQTRAELDVDLKGKGFTDHGTNRGGYTTYTHADGRVVTIKPTGEVIPTSPAVSSRGKSYNQRTDYDFNRVARSIAFDGAFCGAYWG